METKEQKRQRSQSYRKTPKGAAACAWNRLTSRSGAKYNHRECYRNVEVRISREDFIKWAIPEYEMWFFLYPGVQPSIDRIDPLGHYEVGNIRLIPNYLNKLSTSRNRNLRAPDGNSWCRGCQEFLKIESFWKDRQKRTTGVMVYCRDCTKTRRKNAS